MSSVEGLVTAAATFGVPERPSVTSLVGFLGHSKG